MKQYKIGTFSLEPKKIGKRWYVEWGVCTFSDQQRRDRWNNYRSKIAIRDRSRLYFRTAQAAHAACRAFIRKEIARDEALQEQKL
jgi:hypothetical protein